MAGLTDYAGWTIGVISVDSAVLDDRVERINTTLPRRVLLRLDSPAKAVGQTPSGTIAGMVLGAARR